MILEPGKLYAIVDFLDPTLRLRLNLLDRNVFQKTPGMNSPEFIPNEVFDFGVDGMWRKILYCLAPGEVILYVRSLDHGYRLVVYKDMVGVISPEVEFRETS